MSLNTRIRGVQIKDADISAIQLGTDAVETLKIKDLNVTLGKLADMGLEAHILVADASLRPVSVAISGDITLAADGTVAIGSDVIVDADVKSDAAIAGSKLADDSIAEVKLDIHNAPSGVDKVLGYTANGLEWVVQTDTDTFIGLSDTPGAFGSAGQALRVNAGTDALEFYTPTDVDEKVKADAGASAEYLDAIVDGESIEITADDKLAVKVDDSSIAIDAVNHYIEVKDGGITNAMLAGSIAYSKLSLTGEILNADLAGSIADDKLVEDYVKENQIQKATFAGDDSTVAFDIGDTPIVNSVQVFLNGLLQEEGSGKDYTLTDDDITFATAPLTGDFVQIHSVKA